MRRLRCSEAAFDGGDHEIAHHLARDAGIRDGGPGEDLAVANVNDEENGDDLSIAGVDFQMIGAPTDIRAQRDDRAFVRAAGAARRMPFERQPFDLHDPQNALGVHLGPAARPKLSVEERPDPPVAIGGALVDDSAG